MPRTLFDQTIVPSARRRRPLGTVVVSIVLHGLVFAALIAWQLAPAIAAPPVSSRLAAFVLDAPLPVPPAVTPVHATAQPSPVPAVVPQTVPMEAPDHVAPEPTAPPDRPTPTLSGAVGDLGGIGDLPSAGRPATIDAPPPPRGPMPIGGDIRAPVRISDVPLEYPALARAARIEGDVVLEATIDETGKVTNLTVRKSIKLLDAAAIAAVSQWRYTPTRLNGRAVPVLMLVTVRFTLK